MDRVPHGVSSVQGEGRDPLPAAVSTCSSESPRPAHHCQHCTADAHIAPHLSSFTFGELVGHWLINQGHAAALAAKDPIQIRLTVVVLQAGRLSVSSTELCYAHSMLEWYVDLLGGQPSLHHC